MLKKKIADLLSKVRGRQKKEIIATDIIREVASQAIRDIVARESECNQ